MRARRWRGIAILTVMVIAAGVVIALLQPSVSSSYLDPNGTFPTGGHALADLLADRGQRVIRTAAPAEASPGAALELLTSPQLLTSAQLGKAARFNGDILLIAPDSRALRALAQRVSIVGPSAGLGATQPACTAQPAALAGDAYLGGPALSTSDSAAKECYPRTRGNPGYFLIQYHADGRTITVLSTGAPLTNQYLAEGGDAALALNLLRSASQITWVVPTAAAPPAQPGTGQRTFFSLVPWPAYLIAIQLVIAALLAAAWRARRLGPLVAERLPVIVRASETVEGHGRLYQARRARGRAAGELRAAAVARIARLTGGDVSPGELASRAGQPQQEVAALLGGSPPASDQELVALAASLDTLTRKIGQS